MEESFIARVDKAFGSLSSSSPSLVHSSLWSLTDDEIEPKKWNRTDTRDQDSELKDLDFFECFPSGFLDNRDKEQEDEACESRSLVKSDEFGDEELEIKSSIGLDPTLDNEEEEDEYDKVAVGKESSGDRLYMKDISDYETDADYYNPLPNTFKDISKDPRANILAANLRLKEDAEAAENLDAETSRYIESLKVSDKDRSSGDGYLKSILKQEDDHSDSRSLKRVRFDTGCVTTSGEEDGSGGANVLQEKSDTCIEPEDNVVKVSSVDEMVIEVDGLPMETCSMEEAEENVIKGCSAEGAKDVNMETPTGGAEGAMVENYSSRGAKYVQTVANEEPSTQGHPSQVPAYLRNPANYTHYTFDSSTEVDEESNRQAFMDFLNLVKKSKTADMEFADDIFDPSKPVTFIPKRKTGVVTAEHHETRSKKTLDAVGQSAHQNGFPFGMTVMDDVCTMEEDEHETDDNRTKSVKRSGRQYRTKTRMDLDYSQS